MYCTAILHLSFPGFFGGIFQNGYLFKSKSWNVRSWVVSSIYCSSQEKHFLKGILVRKNHCVKIICEFRDLSNINDGAKSRDLFWQKAPSCLIVVLKPYQTSKMERFAKIVMRKTLLSLKFSSFSMISGRLINLLKIT